MANSTPEMPISNGSVVTYNHTFRHFVTGAVIPITGASSITYTVKVRGETIASGSGSVSNGAGGVATASITFSISGLAAKLNRGSQVMPVNVQFTAVVSGSTIIARPQIEYVGMNSDDLAAASTVVIQH